MSVSTSSSESGHDQTVASNGDLTTTSGFQDRDAWAVGIDLLFLRYAGADDARMHFFWGHAEYGIAYARDDIDRTLRSEDVSGESVREESVEQWRLSGSGVRFGLSAYF